jgi:hypothetical protein
MGKNKVFAIATLLAGCASYPQPTESLANSVGAAQGAKEAGAEQVPDAALHLRLANEQNAEAQRLMAEDDNERAAFLTRRAQSDAELALALAHEKDANQRVAEAQSKAPGQKPQTATDAQPAPAMPTPQTPTAP